MAVLSTGQRLKSGVCTTEIMVITAPQEDLDLTCGGAPMTANGDDSNPGLNPEFADGNHNWQTLCERRWEARNSLCKTGRRVTRNRRRQTEAKGLQETPQDRLTA